MRSKIRQLFLGVAIGGIALISAEKLSALSETHLVAAHGGGGGHGGGGHGGMERGFDRGGHMNDGDRYGGRGGDRDWDDHNHYGDGHYGYGIVPAYGFGIGVYGTSGNEDDYPYYDNSSGSNQNTYDPFSTNNPNQNPY